MTPPIRYPARQVQTGSCQGLGGEGTWSAPWGQISSFAKQNSSVGGWCWLHYVSGRNAAELYP